MAMIEHPVPYEYGGKLAEGRIVYDDSVSGKRPAIYMQPDWLQGVCSHTVEMAVDAGQSDHVVLLVDMYGKNYGGMQKTNEELGRVARGNRSNIDFILGCGAAAGESLTAEAEKMGLIDTSKIGAVGYCMGGGYLTEQIRAGAPGLQRIGLHSRDAAGDGRAQPAVRHLRPRPDYSRYRRRRHTGVPCGCLSGRNGRQKRRRLANNVILAVRPTVSACAMPTTNYNGSIKNCAIKPIA